MNTTNELISSVAGNSGDDELPHSWIPGFLRVFSSSLEKAQALVRWNSAAVLASSPLS